MLECLYNYPPLLSKHNDIICGQVQWLSICAVATLAHGNGKDTEMVGYNIAQVALLCWARLTATLFIHTRCSITNSVHT